MIEIIILQRANFSYCLLATNIIYILWTVKGAMLPPPPPACKK